MPINRGTHLVRVYRQAQVRQHDLNPIRDLVDVNGVDVWGLIKPVQAEIIDISPGQIPARRVELWMDSDIDLDLGYLVEVKRTRVLNGARSVTQEALTANASIGATTLTVARTTGFKRGDDVVIWNGTTTWKQAKIKTVGTTSLTLYDDTALQVGFSAGAVVRVSRMYRVEDFRVPEDFGPYRIAIMTHVAHHLVVD